MKNQKTMGNKGFSLVELIVVIAIMAVLVGVLAPQFIRYVDRSRCSTDIQNMNEIKSAIEVYATDNTVADFSVTIPAATTSYTVTDTSLAGALSDAGLPSDKITLKSNKWGAITISYSSTSGVTLSGTTSTAVGGKTFNISGN
ncbi:MAG: prepilin-type N-terminal cleavage/methylation domain-containing protein [Lachnospiraceae bacterium]|nr:prepilin-type N-terminal cleavage/methylation domain-containing protein [Lachnospiraceae bacterium]